LSSESLDGRVACDGWHSILSDWRKTLEGWHWLWSSHSAWLMPG
jgi:hypothetical protein